MPDNKVLSEYAAMQTKEDFAGIAQGLKALYDASVEAGFTDLQAMEITLAWFNDMMKQAAELRKRL